jgi:hypothetical protein
MVASPFPAATPGFFFLNVELGDKASFVHTATNERDKSKFMSSRENREASSTTTTPTPCLGCGQAEGELLVWAVVGTRWKPPEKKVPATASPQNFGVSPTGRHTASSVSSRVSRREYVLTRWLVGTAGLQVDCAYMPRTETIWSYLENGGWASIDTAPQNQDVYLVVTDNSGRPYCLPRPWKLRSHGWMNSERGSNSSDVACASSTEKKENHL